MKLRPMVRADLDAALGLWSGLMANGQACDPRFVPAPDAIAAMRGHAKTLWLRYQPFPHAWVADAEPGLVGFIDLFPLPLLPVLQQGPAARIGDLWVEPAYRRRGLGRELVSHAVGAAADAGFSHIEVGTLAADERALTFWSGQGFEDYKVVLLRGVGPLDSSRPHGAVHSSSPDTTLSGSSSHRSSSRK